MQRSIKKSSHCTENTSGHLHIALASEAKLNNLLNFTTSELESQEHCFLPTSKEHKVQAEKSRGRNTASVLHNTTLANCECFFCPSERHGTCTCESKVSLDTKKEQLAKDNHCFRCTLHGHMAKSCYVKLTCSLCHGRHASSM